MEDWDRENSSEGDNREVRKIREWFGKIVTLMESAERGEANDQRVKSEEDNNKQAVPGYEELSVVARALGGLGVNAGVEKMPVVNSLGEKSSRTEVSITGQVLVDPLDKISLREDDGFDAAVKEVLASSSDKVRDYYVSSYWQEEGSEVPEVIQVGMSENDEVFRVRELRLVPDGELLKNIYWKPSIDENPAQFMFEEVNKQDKTVRYGNEVVKYTFLGEIEFQEMKFQVWDRLPDPELRDDMAMLE